jgi:hypothetical protein
MVHSSQLSDMVNLYSNFGSYPDSTFGIRGVVCTDGKKFKVETLSLPLLSGGMAAYYSLLP